MRNIINTIKRWIHPRLKLPSGEQHVWDTVEGKLYQYLATKGCPDCRKGSLFFEGPSGGVCVNIFCGYCGQGYNISPIVGIAERIRKDEQYIETPQEKSNVPRTISS